MVSLLVFSQYYALIMRTIVFLSPEKKSYGYWLGPKSSPVTVSYLTDIFCVMMLNYSIRLPFNACLRTNPHCICIQKNLQQARLLDVQVTVHRHKFL